MAVDVVIKSGGVFKKKLEFKDVVNDEMRYGIMDEAYRLEEGKIGEYTVVFNAKSICRGYELSLRKGEINLRMPLPTSTDDINFFYEYIRRLCEKMNTKTFIRDGEEVSFADIDNCIKMDVEASEAALKKIEDNLDNDEYTNMYIFGAVNPVVLGKKELDVIATDAKKFGEVMNRLQGMDVYYAKASVYKRKDNTYFGVYVLTEGVISVLPYKPKLLTANNDLKIDDWNIGFVIDGNVEGFISYQDFLNFTKEDDEYDSEHFIITLDKRIMKDLISKYEIEL